MKRLFTDDERYTPEASDLCLEIELQLRAFYDKYKGEYPIRELCYLVTQANESAHLRAVIHRRFKTE